MISIVIAAAVPAIAATNAQLQAAAASDGAAQMTNTPVHSTTYQALPAKSAAQQAAPAMYAPSSQGQIARGALRVELEFSRGVHYHIFSLANPSRIVIDIEHNSAKIDFDKSSLANTPIKNVRTGYREGGVTRVVFDLAKPMQYSSQEEAGSNANTIKLVLKLHP